MKTINGIPQIYKNIDEKESFLNKFIIKEEKNEKC